MNIIRRIQELLGRKDGRGAATQEERLENPASAPGLLPVEGDFLEEGGQVALRVVAGHRIRGEGTVAALAPAEGDMEVNSGWFGGEGGGRPSGLVPALFPEAGHQAVVGKAEGGGLGADDQVVQEVDIDQAAGPQEVAGQIEVVV